MLALFAAFSIPVWPQSNVSTGGAAGSDAPIDREEVWRQYVEWSGSQPPRRNRSRYDYRDQLMSNGVELAEIDERVQIIENRLQYRPDGRQYSVPSPVHDAYGTDFDGAGARHLLAGAIDGLRPGHALDLALGKGDVALQLARAGWRVTGVDISEVNLGVSRGRARRAGLRIDFVRSGSGSFAYGRDNWDLVTMFGPANALGPWVARRISQGLRPGGIVVYQGAPTTIPMRELFPDLEIVRQERSPETRGREVVFIARKL